jgi:hypothetical protein
MSSIVSTDILFFVLPSSPPAEKANGSKPAAMARIMTGAPHAGLSSDKYRPCRHGGWEVSGHQMKITRKLPILTRHNRPHGCARQQTESAGK